MRVVHIFCMISQNLKLLYYAVACNEFSETISVSLYLGLGATQWRLQLGCFASGEASLPKILYIFPSNSNLEIRCFFVKKVFVVLFQSFVASGGPAFREAHSEKGHTTRGQMPSQLCLVVAYSFQKKLQRWQAIGNNVSDLTWTGIEPRTSRSRGERDSIWSICCG